MSDEEDFDKYAEAATFALIRMRGSDFACEKHRAMADAIPVFSMQAYVTYMVRALMDDERILTECGWTGETDRPTADMARLPEVMKAHIPLCEFISESDFAHVWGHATNMGCLLGRPIQ